MATAITEKAADEYKDAKCSICAKKNKDKIADYYCFDCNKHMCTSCLGTHNTFFDNHNVVQGLGNGRDLLTEKCGKHADELITLYCRQHDKPLCRKCCLLDHWKCQDPQNIRDSSDELNADPELQAVPAQLIWALDNINIFHSLVEEVQDVSSQVAMGGEVDRPVQAIIKSPGDRQVRRPVEKREDRLVVKPEKKQSVENPTVSKQVRNIDVMISGDKNMHSIYGCCHLSDGSLVFADFNNKSLKRVDPSGSKVTKYCDTVGGPTVVCCIGPQELAVAFLGSTQVHVYNTVSRTRTRAVELGHETFFIASHGGLLYSAGWCGNILYVNDVSSGRKLREISMDTDGRELFSCIFGIAVNGSGDRVYVTDCKGGLVCVGADGRPIFRVPPEDLGLTSAWGVTTDHHGHVFVSGRNSHNIVKVTEDGHVVGQILSEEDWIKYPFCLSYDVSRSRLYVGAGGREKLLMVEWK